MLASNGTSKPLPSSNGGICSHYPPYLRSLRVFYSLGNSPICYRLLGETDALALPNLAKYFLKNL